MFNQIKEKIQIIGQPAFDPAELNDPLALETGWKPVNRSASNFKTHNFAEIRPGRVGFSPSLMGKLFPVLFIIAGLILVGIFMNESWILSGEEINPDMYALPIVGIVFLLIGAFMLYKGLTPIVFDKNNGYFWKGRKSPEVVHNTDELKHAAKLENIHAIQLLRKISRSSRSGGSSRGSSRNRRRSYYAYELNLVLKDASRLNVVVHGKGKSLLEDAHKLAGFLNVPVWNASRIGS